MFLELPGIDLVEDLHEDEDLEDVSHMNDLHCATTINLQSRQVESFGISVLCGCFNFFSIFVLGGYFCCLDWELC